MKLESLCAWEIGELVNSKQISPTQVVTYFLDRIEKINKKVNAFVYVKADYALEKARELEERLSRGEYCGEFAGVPFGLKDFLPNKKGWQSSHGGVACLVATDQGNSVFCEAMEKAGGIAIGKTNAPAYGFRGTTDNLMYGPTSTPFNPKYNSGGSSGGSAAAVSAGLVPISEGGDAGGSIRIPAGFCNLFGFKAGVGTIPSVCRPDAWSATHPLCFNGALTKCVKDAAILLNYMSYEDVRDPFSLPKKHNFAKEFEINPWSARQSDSSNQHAPQSLSLQGLTLQNRPLQGISPQSLTLQDRPPKETATQKYQPLKIAFTQDFGIFEVEDQVRATVQKAARRFSDLGCIVEEYKFDFKQTAFEIASQWCKGITIDCALELNHLKEEGIDLLGDHSKDFPEEFIYWKSIVDRLGIEDLYRFNLTRTEILDQFEKAFADYDLIISPVSCIAAIENRNDKNTKGPDFINGKKVEPLIGWTQTFLANFPGYPAASIPAGFSKEGVPIGLQLIAPRHEDLRLLQAARLYEEAFDWKKFYPDL
ncbi:MAG: amidase [Treponema sp.]|nr:amidase [Treponema sp.]